MKSIIKILCLMIVINIGISKGILPLTQRYFHSEDMGYDYTRGIYLIILGDDIESVLRDESTGDFIHFKKTQGYDVEIVDIGDEIGTTSIQLRQYLNEYYTDNPLLEYVLLVGDVDKIPAFVVDSYSYDEEDITDHMYTFFDDDPLSPKFFIGRWSCNIFSPVELINIKARSMGYVTMHIPGTSHSLEDAYLNNALMVAGNYGGEGIYPVTPVMTSKWLMDELYDYGYSQVDTVFWQYGDDTNDNSMIVNKWNEGVGIIGYRGWGGGTGWAYPDFRNPDLEALQNAWKLPVVFSFVCNTGDFARGDGPCFAEHALYQGTLNQGQKGAVAVIGPSDKDTDTKFNNVLYASMMDALLENRVPELAPALYAGKQGVTSEFGDETVPGGGDEYYETYAEFYHYVYNVLGDPSLPVWLGKPKIMSTDLNEGQQLISSYISTIITDDVGLPLMDVVGALLYNNELIAKGLSNEDGILVIDFADVPDNSTLELYLNKAQYYQKKITLIYHSDDESSAPPSDYELPSKEPGDVYTAIDSDSHELGAPVYNWIEISETGTNLNLTDDSIIKNVDLEFQFQYYGKSFDKLTICSNGWASFLPCLDADDGGSDCNSIPYFFNNSIPYPLGPYGMLAPFFDDLDDNEGSEPFNVFFWTNGEDSVIVEWDNVANGQHDEDCVSDVLESCPRHTFQLILDSPNIGNGKIIFQYKEAASWHVDDHGSTVGIEAPDKNTGVEYLFNNTYSENVSILQNNLAILFSDCISTLDCSGECGGDAVVDECGECGGDGSSCEGQVPGCMDAAACNFNSAATFDNGICEQNDCSGECGGTAEVDVCEICGGDITDVAQCGADCNATGEHLNQYGLDCSGECGGTDISCLSINENLIPKNFSLNSFPNPFNPVVTVSFALPEMGLASINVFDIRGRELITLSAQHYQPGYYLANWDASSYASGVYFITLITSDTKLTRKVLLLK